MRHVAVFVALLVLAGGPVQAQQADTSTTDTPAEPTTADSTAADTSTVDRAPTDTTAGDTTTVDSVPTDTAGVEVTAADTSAADTVSADQPSEDPSAAAEGDPAPTDPVKGTKTDSLGVDSTGLQTDTAATRSPEERAKQEAHRAAHSWLSLTDAGDFGASWDAADTTLQQTISRDAWIDQGLRARHRLDALQSRHLLRAEFRDSTNQFSRGSPVVVLQYGSAFERDSTLEAVITTKRDSVWRVAGYRVVPALSDTTQIQPDTTLERDASPESGEEK